MKKYIAKRLLLTIIVPITAAAYGVWLVWSEDNTSIKSTPLWPKNLLS